MTTWKMFSESKPLFSDLYLVKFKDGCFLGEYGVCYYSQEHKSFGEFISFYDSERDEDDEAFVSCESIVAWAPFQRIDEEHKEKTAEQMFNDLDYKKRIKDGCIEFERHNGNVIESDLLQAIIQQVKELHWLEEKVEIKEAINPEVTNLEYYKDEILENCIENLAVVKGRPKLCYKTNCNDCDFKINQKECHEMAKDWLKHPHEKPVYKLTKFEKELLECYSDVYSFKVFNSLNGMKEKGYFKGIDDNELIGEILAKCEVV